MTFKLEINCDNAAFEDTQDETAKCLRYVAQCLEEGAHTDGPIIDANGNRVGKYAFKGKRPE